MASYKVIWYKATRSDFKSIPKDFVERILKAGDALSSNPRPQQSLKMEGEEGKYRLRVGDYRLVYHIDDKDKTVLIWRVRHRKEVYR